MAEVRLFVIFHGSWSFLQIGDPNNLIYVKTPDMGEEHAYRAGSWLGELGFRRGALHRFTDNLQGDTKVRFDPSLNLVIKRAKLASTITRGSYLTLVFKKPLQIHSLGQLLIDPAALQRNPGDEIVHQSFEKEMTSSLLTIFEYTYQDNARPAIEGFPWEPVEIEDPGGGGKVATLHFFAEHEAKPMDVEDDHVAVAFTFGSQLLGARFILDPAKVQPAPVQQPVPALLQSRSFELESLRTRTSRMRRLGELRSTIHPKSRKPANPFDAWNTPDAGVVEAMVRAFGPGAPPDDNPTCLPNYGCGQCP